VRFKAVEAGASPALYLVGGEDPDAPRLNRMLFVRASMPTAVAVVAIDRAIRATSTAISVSDARSVADLVRAATSSTRFIALLLVVFAASAVLLAGLGIYGVVSYMVSQRMREFGVRLVLGAEGRDLLRDR
jgi:hypothetical protein